MLKNKPLSITSSIGLSSCLAINPRTAKTVTPLNKELKPSANVIIKASLKQLWFGGLKLDKDSRPPKPIANV